MGGDWGSFLGDNSSGIHYHASNFVLGNLPAGCPQSMKRMTRNVSVEEADDKILQMAQNACAMFKQARQYLVFGEMLASGPLDVPDVPVRFYGLTFSEWKKRTVSMPAVLHCPWKSPEGIVAYALANISDEVQRFRMELPAYVLSGPVNLVLHRNGDEPVVLKNECKPAWFGRTGVISTGRCYSKNNLSTLL